MRNQLLSALLVVAVVGCQHSKPPQPILPPDRVMGIDVAHYQRTIDWPKVKADGKVFAWAKATEGSGYHDAYFLRNMTNAKTAGVIVGAYHYARYDRFKAVDEADFFWSVAKNYITPDGRSLQPMLDVEHKLAPGQDRAFLTQWCDEWCNRVRALAAQEGMTITPFIYCNLNFAKNYFTPQIQENWPLDYANWPKGKFDPKVYIPPTPGVWNSWAVWQYGGSVVPGVPGHCDSDVLNGDLTTLRDYIVGSQGRWTGGARVEVGPIPAKVYPTLSTQTSYSTLSPHTRGIILQGPIYRDSYQRWQVRFANGVTGWCSEESLRP